MTTSEQENREFARRWNEEIWSKQNLDAIDDFVAEDFVGHDPSRPEPVRGPDSVREAAEMLQRRSPTPRFNSNRLLLEVSGLPTGNDLGTHEGEFMGIEPTGNEVEIPNMLFTRIENSRSPNGDYSQICSDSYSNSASSNRPRNDAICPKQFNTTKKTPLVL